MCVIESFSVSSRATGLIEKNFDEKIFIYDIVCDPGIYSIRLLFSKKRINSERGYKIRKIKRLLQKNNRVYKIGKLKVFFR